LAKHALTKEERSRGGHARAEKLREERAEAQALADEELSKAVTQAVRRLAELVESEDEHVALRAAAQVLDRVLGRPTQRESGSNEVHRDMEAEMARARDKLLLMIARHAESRAQRIANGEELRAARSPEEFIRDLAQQR
jgi:hypothetical protein